MILQVKAFEHVAERTESSAHAALARVHIANGVRVLDKNTRQALFHGVSRKQAGSGDTRDLVDCLNQAGQR